MQQQVQALSGADFSFLNTNSNNTNETNTDAHTEWEKNTAEASLVAEQKANANYNLPGTMRLIIPMEMLQQFAALRNYNVTADFKRLAYFIQYLQKDFPKQDGVITQIVSPTLLAVKIPRCEIPEDVPEDDLIASTIALERVDDMTLVHGVPVWERLDSERTDFYALYKLYRDMHYQATLDGEYILLPRAMSILASKTGVSPLLISCLSKIYNWPIRNTYYDFWMERCAEKQRYAKQRLMESKHFIAADKLLAKANEVLAKNIDKIAAKDLIRLYELAFNISRVSVGLSQVKAGSATPQQQSVVINSTSNSNDNVTIEVSASERKLKDDLKDPETLLSVLSVLQRSNAFDTMLKEKSKAEAIEGQAVDIEGS